MQDTAPIIYFNASLRPNQALSPSAMRLITFGLSGLAALGLAAFFAIWWARSEILFGLPILGFLGVDIFALYLALRISRRQTSQETRITVTAEQVALTHTHPGRPSKKVSLPTAFARIEFDEPNDPRSFLRIEYGQTGYVIGKFLTLKERKSLANALRSAIQRARAERYT